jgi:hypothetical protein
MHGPVRHAGLLKFGLSAPYFPSQAHVVKSPGLPMPVSRGRSPPHGSLLAFPGPFQCSSHRRELEPG